MIEKTTTIYFCEYCRKLYQRKWAAERHEQYCKKNPANDHICFHRCPHLVRDVEGGYVDDICVGGGVDSYSDGERYVPKKTTFTCKKTGKLLFSYKAEARKIDCGDAERMPLECDDYGGNWTTHWLDEPEPVERPIAPGVPF